MKLKNTLFLLFAPLFLLASCATTNAVSTTATSTTTLEQPASNQNVTDAVAEQVLQNVKDTPQNKYIRGIHISAPMVGSEKERKIVMDYFASSELNAAVIDIKEIDGLIYIDGVKTADENKAYVNAIPHAKEFIQRLKDAGVYTIARIVVFRDNTMPRRKPSMAVKNPDGTLWMDRKKMTWLDPYNKEAWNYIIEVASRAADLGFDEVQFDYIRFPSDGNTKNCRYSVPHTTESATKAIADFLQEAAKVLHSKGIKVSIDVFGATTSSDSDMGIGQKIAQMTEPVDYVSPMVYPSHFYKGDMGIANPNKSPYTTVYLAMRSAIKNKKIPAEKLRPWLQDFSLFGVKYSAKDVRDQIQAAYDNDIGSWLLWNAAVHYTKSALEGKEAQDFYDKSDEETTAKTMIAETGKNFLKKDIAASTAAVAAVVVSTDSVQTDTSTTK